MRVVAFVYNWRHFRSEGDMLRQLGHEVVVIGDTHWADLEALSPEARGAWDAQLFLCDRSYAARLTRREYLALCGDDIDFPRCGLREFLDQDLPLTEEFFFLDSPFYQRMYALAFGIEQLLRGLAPNLVTIQHGCLPSAAIFAAKCLKHGVPFLVSETAFLRNHILLDPLGMHFFPGQNRLDRLWPRLKDTPLTACQARRLRDFMVVWRQRRLSKYQQPEDERERAMIDEFIRKPGGGKRPLFFIPDQIANDASVLLGLGRFRSLREFIEYCDETLPPAWRIVLKRHPKRSGDYLFPGIQGRRILAVNDINIHSLIESSDAVGTFSSTVGFEALLYGKPVVCGGIPFYSRRGFTLDLSSPQRDRALLAKLHSWKPDLASFWRFAYHVIFEYLVPVGDLKALEARLQEASLENFSNPRAPFSESFPRYTRSYLRAVSEYSRLAEQNLTANEILPRLGRLAAVRWKRPETSEPSGRAGALHSGERQVVSSYAEVETKHLARYAFATTLLQRWRAQSALDLSCGCGYGAHLLADAANLAVTAVDGSEFAIRFASRTWPHPGIQYCVASAGAFFQELRGPYDAVICFETLEHIPNDRLLLEKLWRALKSPGVLLLSSPNEIMNLLNGYLFHVRHYRVETLRALLAGLPGASSPFVWGQAEGGVIGNVPAPPFLIAAVEKKRGNKTRLPGFLRDLIPFALRETPRQKHFYFSPDRFSIPGAVHGEAESIVSLGEASDVVVYGPYTRLPQGRYQVTFGVALTSRGNYSDASLIVDVASTSGGEVRLLARADTPLHSLGTRPVSSRVPLRFEHDVADALVEFRVSVPRRYPGVELRFAGVTVEQL